MRMFINRFRSFSSSSIYLFLSSYCFLSFSLSKRSTSNCFLMTVFSMWPMNAPIFATLAWTSDSLLASCSSESCFLSSASLTSSFSSSSLRCSLMRSYLSFSSSMTSASLAFLTFRSLSATLSVSISDLIFFRYSLSSMSSLLNFEVFYLTITSISWSLIILSFYSLCLTALTFAFSTSTSLQHRSMTSASYLLCSSTCLSTAKRLSFICASRTFLTSRFLISIRSFSFLMTSRSRSCR